MSSELDTANRYRQRAEELRIIAQDDSSKETSSTLAKIADDYDRMADTLEAIDRTNKAMRSRSGP